MANNPWLEMSTQRYFFGFRDRPSAAPDWKRAIVQRTCGLRFEPDGRLFDGREIVGEYRFDDMSAVLGSRSDGPRWTAPHPCTALGQTLGFLTLNWHVFLPRDRRARVSRAICFALHGFVLRDGTEGGIDGVVLGSVPFGVLASKYGAEWLLFEDKAYLDYVEKKTARNARGRGLDAYRAHRIIVEGKGARKLCESFDHGVELWHFRNAAFDDAALWPRVASSDPSIGFFDEESLR